MKTLAELQQIAELAYLDGFDSHAIEGCKAQNLELEIIGDSRHQHIDITLWGVDGDERQISDNVASNGALPSKLRALVEQAGIEDARSQADCIRSGVEIIRYSVAPTDRH